MSHPDALLAEYDDGALAEGERAVVERHLDACERCREEVALARAARAALASVADAPAPGNLGNAAIAEARRRAAGSPAVAAPSGKPGWYRWAGAAAPFADAVACLGRAFTPTTESQGLPGQLVRVIQARFRGTPAILGVYLIGPGAGQPTDIIRVLVASSRGCTILTSTQATT